MTKKKSRNAPVLKMWEANSKHLPRYREALERRTLRGYCEFRREHHKALIAAGRIKPPVPAPQLVASCDAPIESPAQGSSLRLIKLKVRKRGPNRKREARANGPKAPVIEMFHVKSERGQRYRDALDRQGERVFAEMCPGYDWSYKSSDAAPVKPRVMRPFMYVLTARPEAAGD